MKKKSILLVSFIFLLISNSFSSGLNGHLRQPVLAGPARPALLAGPAEQSIPLKEHPRPDFQREQWLNLNGLWDFRFDPQNSGENEKWYDKPESFNKKILVPFPWGSKLSGVENEAEIGWYTRTIEVPTDWSGKKVFIVFGASDWITTAWIDGKKLGTFQGGYTPFEFDVTSRTFRYKPHRSL